MRGNSYRLEIFNFPPNISSIFRKNRDLWATVVMSEWMICGMLVCSHCVSLLVERIEDQFCIFRARFLLRENRPVPLPVAGCVTTCDNFDGGVVDDVVVGRSHRVAPRTTGLTCQPYPRAICKEEALRS